jgi:hypothetical protein
MSMSLSSVAESDDESKPDNTRSASEEEEEQQEEQNSPPELAKSFQTMIQTRRTTSYFEPPLKTKDHHAFWNAALDRALQCARRAPNHKCTEAFSFRRILSPSTATDRLADIAYRAALLKKSVEKAEKKRAKWQAIPAYLIASVQFKQDLYPPSSATETDETSTETETETATETDDDGHLYKPLPFVPITTEREMEDVRLLSTVCLRSCGLEQLLLYY